jgi:prepilin peptidase CpaA
MDAGRTAMGVCLAIVALAAIWDVASRTIPNILSLGGIVLGIALHAALGYTDNGFHGAFRGIGTSLAGLAMCGILPLISFARKEMGGGDVKIFGAIGALCGPILGFNAEAWAFFVLITVGFPVRIIRSGALLPSLKNAYATVANVFRPIEARAEIHTVRLPRMIMGPSIFAGLCVAFALHGVFR